MWKKSENHVIDSSNNLNSPRTGSEWISSWARCTADKLDNHASE